MKVWAQALAVAGLIGLVVLFSAPHLGWSLPHAAFIGALVVFEIGMIGLMLHTVSVVMASDGSPDRGAGEPNLTPHHETPPRRKSSLWLATWVTLSLAALLLTVMVLGRLPLRAGGA
ncbi:MAG: hypothetical protein AAFR04_04620 [Pseudomonadota bacterium]